MKILSTQEYSELKRYKKQYEKEVESVEERIEKILKKYNQKVEDINRKHSLEIEDVVRDANKTAYEASRDDRAKIQKLTISEANLTKEVDILQTAFKNLGFDVKDMKSILTKLVDGVVSKNTINVVK